MPSSRHSTSGEGDAEGKDQPTSESGIEPATSATETTKDDAPYYCPGCGLRYAYPQKCTGRPDSPHQPIEVVSTDELSGDPDSYTAAPSSENLG